MEIKGKVLVFDPLNRWTVGEVGKLTLAYDVDYDYYLEFNPVMVDENCQFFSKGDLISRNYLFLKHEIQVIT